MSGTVEGPAIWRVAGDRTVSPDGVSTLITLDDGVAARIPQEDLIVNTWSPAATSADLETFGTGAEDLELPGVALRTGCLRRCHGDRIAARRCRGGRRRRSGRGRCRGNRGSWLLGRVVGLDDDDRDCLRPDRRGRSVRDSRGGRPGRSCGRLAEGTRGFFGAAIGKARPYCDDAQDAEGRKNHADQEPALSNSNILQLDYFLLLGGGGYFFEFEI